MLIDDERCHSCIVEEGRWQKLICGHTVSKINITSYEHNKALLNGIISLSGH